MIRYVYVEYAVIESDKRVGRKITVIPRTHTQGKAFGMTDGFFLIIYTIPSGIKKKIFFCFYHTRR